MGLLIAGLIIFFAVHSISIYNLNWRDAMAARLGEWGWKGVYSLISLAGFLLIVWGYGIARQEPVVLYTPPSWLRHVAMTLLIFVFPLALAAYLPGRIRTALKHPLLVATKTWALAHLLVNGTLADVLLFGSFLLWAVVDRISVKRRPIRAITSAPAGRFNDLIAVVGGLLIYGAFVVWLHGRLIGVPLI